MEKNKKWWWKKTENMQIVWRFQLKECSSEAEANKTLNQLAKDGYYIKSVNSIQSVAISSKPEIKIVHIILYGKPLSQAKEV